MIKKICSSCKKEKNLEDFGKQKTGKLGYTSRCKNCKSAEYKKYADTDEVRLRKKLATRKRRAENPDLRERERLHKQEYDNKNREAIKERARIRNKTPKEREKKRARYKNDPNHRIKECLGARVRGVLKGIRKSANTITLIGCSIEDLRAHIESQFTEGMSWENHGFYGWHIDHIKPCKAFDLTDPEQQKRCFHYTNLQPLWAEDNLKKNCRYSGEKEDSSK